MVSVPIGCISHASCDDPAYIPPPPPPPPGSIEEKIASLDANLAEIKVNVVHWHRLTSVMRHELDIVQEKRDLEERNSHRLQRRLKHEEGTLQVTKDAILSLDKMKVLLDYRMMVENEETQKKQLSAMRVDTVMLLKDKSRALKAIQSVKSSYDTAISDKREILFLHHLLEHVHETLLEWQNGMNSSIWAPSEILLACVDHESKADAVRKTQQLRFRTLMDTKKRGSTASGARISDMEPGDTSDDDSGGPSSEEIIVLKRKLAEITAEKEEFKRRAKSEMYQLSCRECVDCGKFSCWLTVRIFAPPSLTFFHLDTLFFTINRTTVRRQDMETLMVKSR